jgi:hypothetical protein
MAGPDRSTGGAFAMAAAPARWIGRFRPDLEASVEADAITFAGPRRTLFALLAVIAVAYPVAAAFTRSVTDVVAGGWDTHLDQALNPMFPFVYAGSLPYMIVAIGLGVASPALGVLFVLFHAPVDLLASAVTQFPGAQLTPVETAVPARLISVAVLWIGAVELPLLARRWAATWPASAARPSAPRSAIVLAVAMATLSFLWVSAAFWLVMPAWSWTVQGGPGSGLRLEMWAATLLFGWIVPIGVGLIALATGLLAPARALARGADYQAMAPRLGLGRELLNVVIPGILLAGLMLRPSESFEPISNEAVLIALIVGGLLLTGPILNRLLPRLPVPSWLARLPSVVRWGAALAVAVGVSALVVSLVPVGAISDVTLLAVLFAIMAPVVRIIVDAGVDAATGPNPTGVTAAIVGTILRLLVILAIWLALPAIALGEDESPGMPQGFPAAAGAAIGGAALGSAMSSRRTGDKGGGTGNWNKPPGGIRPKETPSTPPPSKQPDKKDPPKDDRSLWQKAKDGFNGLFGG